MSDTTSKLRAIQAALDEGRAIDLEGLDGSARADAEGLARVDAWLRALPTPSLTDAEDDALARRIEQRLGETLPAGDDLLAAPDFSEWGDDEGELLAAPPTSSGEYALDSLAARASVPGASMSAASDPAASAPAAPSRGETFARSPVEAAESRAPLTGAVAPSGGGAASGGAASGGGSRGRAWFFASAAVLGLAVTGSFVALQRASAPDEAPSVAASMSSEVAAPAPAEIAEPAAAPLGSAEGSVGGIRAQNVAPAAPGVAEEPTLGWAEPRAEARRARPATRSVTVPAREALEEAESSTFEARVRRGAPTMAAPSVPSTTATAPAAPSMASGGGAWAATEAPAEAAMDDTSDAMGRPIDGPIVRRREVFRCVDVPSLLTDVRVRDARVVEVTSTTPRVDEATRACLTRALRGAPLEGSSTHAILRWRR